MVHEGKLSAVLSDFARTLITDFPIQGILDRLVARIVEILPVTAAGVTLISDGTRPRYIAASNDVALRYEQLQSEVGHGPCLLAFETGKSVAISDLSTDHRFPLFSVPAMAAGLAAVFTFPLRHDGGCIGALDLYRDSPGPLDVEDLVAAQTLADVVTAYLLNAQARTNAHEASERFKHGALHDTLTGLPNRQLLKERIDHAAKRANRSRTSAAILFADLDGFKFINDHYGHQVGDQLLIAVADRLSALVRPGDTLARVAGDEFVFLCEDLHGPDDAEVLAGRITRSFTTAFLLDGLELFITASIGVAFAGPGERVSEELIVHADSAMYKAKHNGGASHQVADTAARIRSSDRAKFNSDLRTALERNTLDVAYQPIVRTADKVVTGVEALVRWSHRVRGNVAPTMLIEHAEEGGLIYDIGAWILQRACRDHSQWRKDHPNRPMNLAVNISGRQVMGPGFSEVLAVAIAAAGTDPSQIILEMTENVLIEDSERAMTVLRQMKALGVRLALDDFGTGFSSLSYLRRLPIDIVKIDQSFISDMIESPTAGTIVEAITTLSHVLGLTVVAEGVETKGQHERIRFIGCEAAQGFFYGRPMAAADVSCLIGAN